MYGEWINTHVTFCKSMWFSFTFLTQMFKKRMDEQKKIIIIQAHLRMMKKFSFIKKMEAI